jgi:predicted metal-dependent hydrolase
MDDEAIRLAIVSKLPWIRRHQKIFAEQPRQSEREMVGGESHYVEGRRYLLRVGTGDGPSQVRIIGNSTLLMYVRPGTGREKREKLLNEWYRQRLKAVLPSLIDKWQQVLGVQVSDWGIKRMKTRWGSCNTQDHRIWQNLELAKKPPQCLECVLVHEMIHLIERRYSARFETLMDEFLPQWRFYRDELSRAPLAHEEWAS